MKTDAKKVIQTILEKLPEINNKFANINYGGCGTFSYHLYNNIKQKYNIEPEIYYIKAETPPGLMPNYDICFSHILLKIGDYYIDNNNKYDVSQQQNELFQKLDIEKLQEMINIKELWNDVYDHSKTNELVNYLNYII
jgi:hypothetical protein